MIFLGNNPSRGGLVGYDDRFTRDRSRVQLPAFVLYLHEILHTFFTNFLIGTLLLPYIIVLIHYRCY